MARWCQEREVVPLLGSTIWAYRWTDRRLRFDSYYASLLMKKNFNEVPLKKIANGQGLITRYPTLHHLITIEIHDPELERMVGCIDFDIDKAIELRDWLNAAIPKDSI